MQSIKVLLIVLSIALASAHVFRMGVHKVNVLKAGGSTYPLQGNIDHNGEFFVNVSLGNPPQVLRLQVDTGSTDLVVFSKGCEKCPTGLNVTWFDEEASKTDQVVDCDADGFRCDQNNCWNTTDGSYCPLDIQYGGGGEIEGYAVTDQVTLGSLSARAPFGLIQTISGPFEEIGVDGAWGFAYDLLSSWGGEAAVDHMTKANNLYNSFSMCLTPSNPVMDIGTNYQGASGYEWVKVSPYEDEDYAWYTVEMEDFLVGGVSLGIPKFELNWDGVIVDSGTTLFIVSKKVMAGVQTHITSLCAKYNNSLPGACNSTATETLFTGYCFPMTDEQVALFPNISTPLTGMSTPLVIPPQAYMWEGAGIPGTYCLGIQTIDESDLPIILGDVVMQNYHVVFDKVKNMVGWGPLSSCPTP